MTNYKRFLVWTAMLLPRWVSRETGRYFPRESHFYRNQDVSAIRLGGPRRACEERGRKCPAAVPRYQRKGQAASCIGGEKEARGLGEVEGSDS